MSAFVDELQESYCTAPTRPNSPSGRMRDKYRLVGVVVLMRHGDRHSIAVPPDSVRTAHTFPCDWSDPEVERMFATTQKLTSVADSRFPLGTPQCAPGILTPRGFVQTYSLGASLRTLYADGLGLLDAHGGVAAAMGASPTDAVAAMATSRQRTTWSAAAFAAGFLAGADGGDAPLGGGRVQVVVEELEQSPLLFVKEGAAGCPSALPELERLYRLWDPLTPAGAGAVAGDGTEGHMAVTDWFDAVAARACHSMPLPCASAAECRQRVATGVSAYLTAFTTPFHALRRASARLLHRIVAAATAHPPRGGGGTLGGAARRLHVWAAHDLSVTPLLAALGVEVTAWPPYASYVAFETYEPATRPEGVGRVVRVVFNGADITAQVEACAGVVPCPLSSFESWLRHTDPC